MDPHYDSPAAARGYDILDETEALAGDLAFYLDCARAHGGPILELGTGTGRIAIPLAEAGFEVTGLDLSAEMLSVAREKTPPAAASRLSLVQGDMTDFDLGQSFALSLIPARAFQHVTTPQGQRAALSCIHRHLEPGGHLVIDMFDPRIDLLATEAPPGPTREGRDPVTAKRVRRTTLSRRHDYPNQIFCEEMRTEVLDADGTVLESGETEWQLRWTLRQEMTYLFELTGFDVVAEYSAFDRSPPAYGREQIWVVRAALA